MDKVEELLTRGVDTIYPSREALEKMLRSDKRLKLYQGFDPTGTQLHIGHMVGFRKLRQWQDLGHHVIFLIGDGTGQAGDPSGRTTVRETFFTREELRRNAVDYVKQAGKIVRFEGDNAVEILFNGDWLNALTLVDILTIANHFTLSQLAERDLFRERATKGEEVNLREFLYPLLQAYDSVAMNIDLEIGGTDQTFNMLMGRHLVKAMQGREKFVMTTPLLTDAQGRKIGKTEGNVIALTDAPEDLFGKIMALPDDIILKGFEYLTDVPMGEIQTMASENPLANKKRLAFEIAKQLNSESNAKSAQEAFERTVQRGELPADIPIYTYAGNQEVNIVDLIVTTELAASKSEARRLVEQRGTAVDQHIVSDPNARISVKDGMLVQVGKRRFVKLSLPQDSAS